MPPERDASALCLACGLCCAGAFYDLVPLDPDELDHARRLRLPLSEREPMLTFRLPCPRLDGNACTVYAERPRECAAFACVLLRAYRDGAVEMDEALRRVATARAAFTRVHAGEAGAREELSAARRRWFDA
jgi:Fe-S-cluster containining protein